MGTFIDRLPHKTDKCNSSDGLAVYAKDDGTVDGYCWVCCEYVTNPYGEPKKVEDLPPPKIKTPAEIAAEIAEVEGYQFLELPERKLRAASLEKFGIRVAVSEHDGKTPQAAYIPLYKNGKRSGYKVKTLGLGENNFTFSIGDAKGVDLFNWENARKSGAYRLIITEGEFDAVAVDRIYEMHGKEEYKPAVFLCNTVQDVLERAFKHTQKRLKASSKK